MSLWFSDIAIALRIQWYVNRTLQCSSRDALDHRITRIDLDKDLKGKVLPRVCFVASKVILVSYVACSLVVSLLWFSNIAMALGESMPIRMVKS